MQNGQIQFEEHNFFSSICTYLFLSNLYNQKRIKTQFYIYYNFESELLKLEITAIKIFI